MRKTILAVLTAATLMACSSGQRPLHDMRSSTGGPDEFSVIPLAALEIPATMTLPAPTPGGANLTDATPKADAIAALGGNAAVANTGGIPASDAALVARAGRNGTQSDIRSTLANEDARFRAGKKRLGFLSILSRDRYFKAYSGSALDAYAELARFRAAGVATPTAPPAN